VLVAFESIRRAGNFAVARPTRELLYTVVSRADRYKAKSFIDTFVYRLGDQIGNWSWALMNLLGFGIVGVSFVAAPIMGLWLAVALWLGVQYRRREQAEPVVAPASTSYSDLTHEPSQEHFMTTRRDFIHRTAAAAGAAALGSALPNDRACTTSRLVATLPTAHCAYSSSAAPASPGRTRCTMPPRADITSRCSTAAAASPTCLTASCTCRAIATRPTVSPRSGLKSRKACAGTSSSTTRRHCHSGYAMPARC
jgi:hypothetical protein